MALVCTQPQNMKQYCQKVMLDILNSENEDKVLLQTSQTVQDVKGIVTMENVLESLLRVQILDEKDLDKKEQNDTEVSALNTSYGATSEIDPKKKALIY